MARYTSRLVSGILKSYVNAGKEADLYYLRDGNHREIDLLIYQDNTLYPLEIKLHSEPSPSDIKHFAMLEIIKNIKIGEGGVICTANELLPISDKHKIIPLWAI